MTYISRWESPLGDILLAADGEGITGLWFQGAKYFARGLGPDPEEGDLPLFRQAREWLEVYFSGREPDFLPPLHPAGSGFQQAVWRLLAQVPYGATTTYGRLARQLEEETGRRASPQAVGGAVGHNPISLLIPCHRVVGSGGSLTGYAGGIEKKAALLALEGADCSRLSFPRRGTAL